jgi:hypothetical protein
VRALREHAVELGGELMRRLQARLPAVQGGYVAELATVGASAGELQAGQQVAVEREQVVGRNGEIVERQPLPGFAAHLRGGRRRGLIKPRDQIVGPVADLADVEIVGFRIIFRRRGDGRSAQHRRFAGRLRASDDVVDLRRLDVHAADQHHVRPGKVGLARRAEILIDEADRPPLGQIGCDHQKPLRRHERAHAPHQRIGVRERAERVRVGREYAEDPALIPDGKRATHVASQSPPIHDFCGDQLESAPRVPPAAQGGGRRPCRGSGRFECEARGDGACLLSGAVVALFPV